MALTLSSLLRNRRRIAAVLACACLAACSLLRPPAARQPLAAKTAAAAAAPALPTPVATERFVLKGPHDDVVGYVQKTVIGKHDALPDVARRFDIGYDEVVLANPGVDPWLPGVGRVVVVPTEYVLPQAPHRGVVINLAAMRIFYYPPRKRHGPQIVYTHPIGIGRIGWKTPEGTTRIISRQKDPVWIVPKSIRKEHAEDGDILPAVVPPGPDNPLGEYLFRLGWPSYLIHGTNKPYGVGMRVSHGCMHLYPEDIKQFFDLIPVGTKVTIVNQPYVFGWRNGTLYLQAYAVMKDDKRDWSKDRKQLLVRLLHPQFRGKIRAHEGEIDWQRVVELARAPRGVPVPITNGKPGIDALIAHSPLVADMVPTGSNWDGVNELSIDQKTYDELLGDSPKPASAATVTQASPQ
ncbi:MAG TPA: L,D-transpeptidase family protein [Steroidobacteraceae bacterium]|nr:L,D-transpeptidase family protein [Steroidobacteraceae bacterium]